MKEIELFEHNEEAYKALTKSLENNNFSFIERATGTGKSYILIKYLAQNMSGKRVLFVTTHEPMFKQFIGQDMETLGTSKDIYDKLDLVIYPNINKKSAEWYFENYDCFIFDEAHHCGAPIWGETIGELRDLVKTSEDKTMIGATATSIRYLDDYTDVAEMFFDNNVASRLSLSSAILREILPAPLYINISQHITHDISRIKRKLDSIGNLKELQEIRNKIEEIETKFETEKDVNKLLKENGVKEGEKYIIFCSNKEDLENKMEQAEYWFKDIGQIEKYKVHSGLSKRHNESEINKFKEDSNKIKLMFAIDIFNEGMHVPGVDGVILSRRTISPIVYLQQIGRALSFSVRKKQIKIFDLVGNASNIDVVHNIYKELLLDAEEEIINNPDKKEHYEKIIERFKIVKKGNELIDTIDQIEEYLDNYYIIKNSIDRNITYLEYYTSILNGNFMILLEKNKIDQEHKEMFKKLKKLANKLSIEQIYRLNKIGIILSEWQKDEEVLEKIKINGSYSKIAENEFIDTVSLYNEYYLKYKHLPSIDSEKELVNKYRYYLANYTPARVKRELKRVDYKLNVEEILIFNGYPSKKDLQEYLNKVEKKYYEGLLIDKLELKTLRKISLLMDLKDRPAINSLISNKTAKIDEAIKTIKEKVADYYESGKYISVDLMSLDKDALSSYMFIKKNYKHITNSQFEIMLDMNLELFKEIDMTMEERIKKLNGYDTEFDLENAINRKTARAVIDFINKHNRRPDEKNETEHILVNKYNELMKYGNSIFMREIGQALVNNNLKLTFNEKFITEQQINSEEIEYLYSDVLNTIQKCNKESFIYRIERKKIETLKKYERIDFKYYKILTRTIIIMEEVFNKKYDRTFTKENLEKKVWNSKDVIPANLISYINERDIVIPHSLYNQIKNISDENINLASYKYKKDMENYEEFFKYIEENNTRPPRQHHLTTYINKYLLDSNTEDRNLYLKRINSMGMPVLPEELFMCNRMTKQGEYELYDSLKNRKDSGIKFNSLERYLFETLSVRFLLEQNGEKIESANLYNKYSKESIANDFIESIKEQIKEDPYKKLDLDGELHMLLEREKKLLKEYRISCLATDYLTKIKERMKKENASLSEILETEDKTLYEEIIESKTKQDECNELISEIEKIDKDIVLKRNNISINEIIDEYMIFIKQTGKLPDELSSDMIEKTIANKYNLVLSISNTSEKKKLALMSKKALEEYSKKGLYENFLDFVNLNERMPSILSDDENEVELAKAYQRDGSKLKKEERLEISKLQKKYQLNTINYFKNKKGK